MNSIANSCSASACDAGHERHAPSVPGARFAARLPHRLVYCVAAALTLCATMPACYAAEFVSAKPSVRVDFWQHRQAEITSYLKDSKDLSSIKLVFLGDSITHFWLLGDSPWFKGQKFGRKSWNESFAGQPPENLGLNLGISGDRIEHILYRLQPKSAGGLGELDRPDLNPEFVIVLVGINNTYEAEEPVVDSVFEGIQAVVKAVHERKPDATVILQSLLPTGEKSKNRDVVLPVNKRLARLASSEPFSRYIIFFDTHAVFVDSSGRQLTQYFNDGLHPNEAGYRVWRERLVPFLQQVRASRAVTPAGK